MPETSTKILITGATGFVGGRLLRALSGGKFSIRCLVRSAAKFRRSYPAVSGAELFEGDLLTGENLERALQGVDAAFYLVHSMGGGTLFDAEKFAERDRQAARNFVTAADHAGVPRIIYLGGLGEVGDNLSQHLASRQEVAEILRAGNTKATILRAANIIGAGGAPFEMLRHLVERLPVLLAPRWVDTRCQPIDIGDVVSYLSGCIGQPATAGREFDIGGPNIITYREMMNIYARVRNLKRVIISVPLMTTHLSSLWIAMLTPVPSGVVVPLLEGLRNEVICRENNIRDLIPIRLTPLEVSICKALQEVSGGPGKLLSQQSCFLSRRYD